MIGGIKDKLDEEFEDETDLDWDDQWKLFSSTIQGRGEE